MKIATETKMLPRVLVVTNDSTVFLVQNRIATAFELFGGRMTEVKNLVARLDTATKDNGSKLCDLSFGVISTKYGFVPGNYNIMSYPDVMDSKEGYEECDQRTEFVARTSFITRAFDIVIFCVPKDMFAMFLDYDDIADGKLIAVTSADFKDVCEKKGWTWLERKGARVGDANADRIMEIVRERCA